MAIKSFVFRFDDIEVREQEFSLTKAGQVLTVEPKAFRALLFLLRNPQRLISKEELLNSVWGDAAVTEGSLTRCIWLLRSVLGDDIRNPRYVETVATVGYRFIAKVEVSEEAGAGKESNGLSEVEKRLGSRRRFWSWVLAGSPVLLVCLAAAIWYLHRPLSPLRVKEYTQLTHDGHKKYLVGTDGSRLYLTQTNENDLYFRGVSPESISQIALSGGESAQIPIAVPNSHLADISADGSNLLVFSMSENERQANPLWNVRTLGGQVRRLGEAVDASFSPDGNSVAYSTPEGDIWLERNDGTGTHKLASPGGSVFGITWSPDGGIIRFNKDDAIWEMSSSGSNPHPSFPGRERSFSDCCGRWTTDGKLFVFTAQAKGQFDRGEIWVLDERREMFRPPAGPAQLAGGPTIWGRPIPGKDGRTIFAEGQTPRGELSRYDSKTKQFQPFLGGISAQGAVFSKDGKSVAYVSYPEEILWKANADGSNPVQLTDTPMSVFLPRWSPDSTQIVFTGLYPGGGTRIYIVSSEGGSPPKRLSEDKEPRNTEDFAYWSPDGHKVAFNVDPDDSDLTTDIRILDLDTRKVTTIPGSVGLIAPRWSPVGRYLSATGEGLHLKIFDLETQQWSELTLKGTVASPEWSRDGRYIYFRRRVTGDLGIFRISIKGGAAEKIVDLKDWHDAGWFGAYMGLDPTDAPLLLRDIGSDDIYALTLDQK